MVDKLVRLGQLDRSGGGWRIERSVFDRDRTDYHRRRIRPPLTALVLAFRDRGATVMRSESGKRESATIASP